MKWKKKISRVELHNNLLLPVVGTWIKLSLQLWTFSWKSYGTTIIRHKSFTDKHTTKSTIKLKLHQNTLVNVSFYLLTTIDWCQSQYLSLALDFSMNIFLHTIIKHVFKSDFQNKMCLNSFTTHYIVLFIILFKSTVPKSNAPEKSLNWCSLDRWI